MYTAFTITTIRAERKSPEKTFLYISYSEQYVEPFSFTSIWIDSNKRRGTHSVDKNVSILTKTQMKNEIKRCAYLCYSLRD